jgi:hypothetical protein
MKEEIYLHQSPSFTSKIPKWGGKPRKNELCISIITSALLLASTTIFFLLPWHGIVYVPVLVVGSLAERVRSQIPDVERIQLQNHKLSEFYGGN